MIHERLLGYFLRLVCISTMDGFGVGCIYDNYFMSYDLH